MTEPVSGTSKLTVTGLEDQFRFDESARARTVDYDQKDLAI